MPYLRDVPEGSTVRVPCTGTTARVEAIYAGSVTVSEERQQTVKGKTFTRRERQSWAPTAQVEIVLLQLPLTEENGE